MTLLSLGFIISKTRVSLLFWVSVSTRPKYPFFLWVSASARPECRYFLWVSALARLLLSAGRSVPIFFGSQRLQSQCAFFLWVSAIAGQSVKCFFLGFSISNMIRVYRTYFLWISACKIKMSLFSASAGQQARVSLFFWLSASSTSRPKKVPTFFEIQRRQGQRTSYGFQLSKAVSL